MSLIDELLQTETTEDRIWMLHREGMAPSEIAAEAGVTAERAHDEVVRRWAEDKTMHESHRARA